MDSINCGQGMQVIDVAQQPREVLAEAWRLLLDINVPPRLFRRGNALVMLAKFLSSADELDGSGDLVQVVSKDILASLLVEHADWVRAENPTQPPDFMLRMMIAQPHPALPKLECITSVPILAPSGRIVYEGGYHAADNLYLWGDSDNALDPVPLHPTRQDRDAARVLLLEELLIDFPFWSHSDRAHALALLLLLFVRPFLHNALTPLHLLTAPPGSGKSLLAQVASYIISNKPAVITTLNSHDGETRKKLTALLLQAAPVVVLDNLHHGVLDNASLASVLTAPFWTDRQLGHSRALRIRNQTVWLATGNNPRFSMELARRAVRIRLDSLTDRPWLRTGFRHPDLTSWVRENRHPLVHACLTLIQSWLDEGQPAASVKPLGSFERWSEVLGGILHVAGVPGFLDDLDDLYREVDAEGQERRILTARWWSRFQGQYVRVTDLLPLCAENDLMFDVLGQGSERSQKSRLGRALQRCNGRVFGNFCIEQDSQATHNSGRYRLRLLRATGEFPAHVEGTTHGL